MKAPLNLFREISNNLVNRNQNLQFAAANLLGMISTFLLILAILNVYGVNFLGVFSLILSINLIVPLLDLGYANSIANNFNSSKDGPEIINDKNRLRTDFLVIPGLFYTTTAIVALYHTDSIYTSIDGILSTREIRLLVTAMTFNSFMLLVFNVAHKIRLALNLYKMSSYILAINSMVVLISSALAIWMKSSFTSFVMVYVISSWLTHIFFLNRTIKLMSIEYSSDRMSGLKRRKGFNGFMPGSLTFFVAQLSTIFAFQLDNFIVVRYLSLEDVATYATAIKFVAVPIAIIASYSLPLWTETSRGVFGANKEQIFVNLSKILKKRLLLIMPVALISFLTLPFIVDFWSSGKLKLSADFVACLSVWLVTAVITQPIAMVTNGMLFKSFILFSGITGAILNISISIFLCRNYNLLAGPIIGSVVSQIVTCLIPYHFIRRKFIKND